MSKFKGKKKSKEAPAITTASLPDIVFMLLCFFMVVTKMRETDIKVRTKVPQISELRKIENKYEAFGIIYLSIEVIFNWNV